MRRSHRIDLAMGGSPVSVTVAEGRLARCVHYGQPWDNPAAIIPAPELCGPKGCFCLVPSDSALPLFSLSIQERDLLCAVRGEGPLFDSRGFCRFGPNIHAFMARRPATRIITVRFAGHCDACAGEIAVGARARWAEAPGPFQPSSLFHLDPCAPLHGFVRREGVGDDLFYCGCQGS